MYISFFRKKEINRNCKRAMSEANLYFFVESAIALMTAFVINAFVMSVFADSLYGKTNSDLMDACSHDNISVTYAEVLKDDNSTVNADIFTVCHISARTTCPSSGKKNKFIYFFLLYS